MTSDRKLEAREDFCSTIAADADRFGKLDTIEGINSGSASAPNTSARSSDPSSARADDRPFSLTISASTHAVSMRPLGG